MYLFMELSDDADLEGIKIGVDSQKMAILFTLERVLNVNHPDDYEELREKFSNNYDALLQAHAEEDTTDLARFYRLIMSFKPALSSILKPGQEFDEICNYAIQAFNVVLNRVRGQVKENRLAKKKGPIIPGSDASIDLRYFCAVCQQDFEIPPEKKEKLLNSDGKMDLPEHHGQEMQIKIIKAKQKEPAGGNENKKKVTIYPAEMLMGHVNSEESSAEYLDILSVGIDVGSSTSHLVFSRITLKREYGFYNMTRRFVPVSREIVYKGTIIFTPLLDRFTIDIEKIVHFFKEEYEKAGIKPEDVDTGAVIVTGETAKKQNAAEIVRRLSSESGKFVSATAGPNFESMLGAMGSGAVERSRQDQNTILNVDVGGGTSNLAICTNGTVQSTSCINVGGRLLGIDQEFKIWRVDEPTYGVMKELGMEYELGQVIPEDDTKKIARAYAKALLEVMQGPATTKIAKMLMMTEELEFTTPIDRVSFSGGVAELIYGNESDWTKFDDIGKYLADEIKGLVKEGGMVLIEPENKIRATVIGAGSFSLSISGSTCFVDEKVSLPIQNIPVLPVDVFQEDLSPETVSSAISRAYSVFDMVEGEDVVALYFKNPIYPREGVLSGFAKALEAALPNSVKKQNLVILIFRGDLAKLLGVTLRRETRIQQNLICLDELDLEAGDWIDIGGPLQSSDAYPVTIKSLVFNKE